MRNELSSAESFSEVLIQTYREDPAFFVEHALGHFTWSKQREILYSVRDNLRTAVRACHGSSKTFTAAEIAVWFLNVFPNPKVITTAPTNTQIKKLLWSEINTIYQTSRIRLRGICQTLDVKIEEDPNSFAIGFSTKEPVRAEGWHAPQILFIFDEAKGIPGWLWDSVRGLQTGGFCRWLVISTTDGVSAGEEYWKIFNQKQRMADWNKIRIRVDETPYSTGEKFRTIIMPDTERLDIYRVKWVDPKDVVFQISGPAYKMQCEKDWGKDSPLYQTKVEAEIVDAGSDTIVKLSQVEKMFENYDDPQFSAEGQLRGGIDVARGGTADTVMKKAKGLKVLGTKVVATPNLPEKAILVHLADIAETFFEYNKKIPIKIDDTGVGGGLTDILQSRRYNVIPINFGGVANEPDKYPNVASEMWFEVGKIIHEIAHPRSDRLESELVNRREKNLDKKGRRVVESKDEYVERAGRSPDEADSLLLTFYDRGMGPSIGGIQKSVRPE